MAKGSRHTFVFRGTVELNPDLDPWATHFINQTGAPTEIRQPNIDGLVFGFMEAPEGLVVTQVDEILLRHRFLVDPTRHLEGGGLGPNGKNIGEEAAAAVLGDAIAANSELASHFEAKRGKLRMS